MKVAEPRIVESGEYAGFVMCEDCPYANEFGWFDRIHNRVSNVTCGDDCPTAATYAEACRLAEEANGV